jgi:FAD synthetase
MESKKGKVVLASGAFDLMHYGHVYYLTNAKKAGGENAKLVVVVARDKMIERLKGNKPVIPEEQRRAVVEALKVVDEAVLGYEDLDMAKVIAKVNPDIVALGHDQKEIAEKLRKVIANENLNTQVVTIGKFEEKELDSSSKIKKKIIENYQKNLREKLPS